MHSAQPTECPTDLKDPVGNFILLLPDLDLRAQFLACPRLYCLQLFQVCYWLHLPEWSRVEIHLISKAGPATHSFLPFFGSPLLTTFLDASESICSGSLMEFYSNLDLVDHPKRCREDAAFFVLGCCENLLLSLLQDPQTTENEVTRSVTVTSALPESQTAACALYCGPKTSPQRTVIILRPR